MNCIQCKREIVYKLVAKDRIIVCDDCTCRLVVTYSKILGEEPIEKRLERLAKARNRPKKPCVLPNHMKNWRSDE